MTDPDFIMGLLQNFFGDEVDVYFHQGYESGADDFWHEDQDWDEDNPGTHTVLFEEQISEDTSELAGFTDEAESAVWFKNVVVEEGDRIDYRGNSFLVISASTHRQQGQTARQLAGVRSIDV